MLGVRVAGRRGGGVKARERELSRAVQFKASYLLGVVKHAGDVGEVVEHLRLAFEDYLDYGGGGDVDGFVNGLLRELGFGSLLELALYRGGLCRVRCIVASWAASLSLLRPPGVVGLTLSS